MSSLRDTSPTMPIAPGCSCATRSTPSRPRATKATRAPRAISSRTSARPRPEVPPVTATLAPWLECRMGVSMKGLLDSRIESPQESSRHCPIRWPKVTQMDKPERIAAHLARNLTSLRHARGLTQAALARSAGLPRSTIANLESGDGNPSLAVLVKVAARLGVPIDELLASPRAKVRKWTSEELPVRARGRGVSLRPLVPEPVPEEMLERMEFAP